MRGGFCFAVATTFHHSTRDPFAIKVTFQPPHSPPVVWYMDRELLLNGTRAPAGMGDVRIRPVPGPGCAGGLQIRLGIFPCVHFTLDRAALTDWLSLTCALVPPGTESEHLDWQPLNELLRSA
ncbi:SsgA family sporulation/cell division regulator [Streptomyces sp. NPDC057445]|uniref:SsgA family sporulation/cell division regulator n=1 Tax=Streptomyces sp. NPDC057445 TaxID=3346136 RepID=UPI00369FEDEE